MLVILVAGTGLSAAATPTDHLTSFGPVDLTGVGQASADHGHLYATGPMAISAARLTAETIVATVEWERGVRSGPEAMPVWSKTDHGTTQHALHNVEVGLSPDGGTAELLAFPDQGQPSTTVTSLAYGQASYESDRVVAYAGPSGQAQRVGQAETAGFVYQLAGPTVWLAATGTGTMQGDFSLFVNNLTLTAEEASGSTWTNWSGYREAQPGAPVSLYERRVIVLEVHNGTLTTGDERDVAFFGPTVDARLEGLVRFEDVSGRLDVDDQVLSFDREPLVLEGEVILDLAATPAGSSGSGGDEEPGLHVAPSGGFRTVPVDGQATTPTLGDGADGGGVPWLVGFLGASALWIALGTVAVTTGVAGRVTGAWQGWRFHRAMMAGEEAMAGRDWPGAVVAYEAAVAADPDVAHAWALLSISLLEAGEFERCLGVLDRAERAPGMDPWDILEFRAAAAWSLGDNETAAAALEQMAEMDAQGTRLFAEDLALDLDEVAPGVRDRLGPGGAGGGLDGYV